MVSLMVFNRTIKNILSNYIPHKAIICNDKDSPWINNNIKQLIQEKNNTYKSYILSDKNPQIFENQLKCLVEGNKETYYLRISKKLMDPITCARTSWSILKTSLNKKIPFIPRSFIRIKMEQILKRKQNYFTPSIASCSFFAKQCFIIQNSSKHPLP